MREEKRRRQPLPKGDEQRRGARLRVRVGGAGAADGLCPTGDERRRRLASAHLEQVERGARADMLTGCGGKKSKESEER
jgi:hypothetical protein